MKFVLFTFYYPPDLSAGSFRAKSLIEALKTKIEPSDEIHVITTKSSRYKSYSVNTKSYEEFDNVRLHRIDIPNHQGGIFSQALFYCFYAAKALSLCKKVNADFLIGTSSRLMTGALTWIASKLSKAPYCLDIRDIFSESFSDVFFSKNSFLKRNFQRSIILIERIILTRAEKVIVNSEDFKDYFLKQRIDTKNWSFYPNGVDSEFLNLSFPSNRAQKNKEISVLYAGNIGFAQSLSSLIPMAAKKLEGKYFFNIIGDGTDRKILQNKIASENINNILISPPVSRTELIDYYQKADVLLINLKNLRAFQRVLPSKIFEYGSIGKPIVAGLSGYSKKFLEEHLTYANIFNPDDVEDFIKALNDSNDTKIKKADVANFCNQFSRKNIMDEMALEIISAADQKK